MAIQEFFSCVLVYGGVATAALAREMYARYNSERRAAVLATFSKPHGGYRYRTVSALSVLFGRGELAEGADPKAHLAKLIAEKVAHGLDVNGWGPGATFNAATDRGWGKPMLVTAFGASKAIQKGTILYTLLKDYIAPDLAQYAVSGDWAYARPAVKLLQDPDCLAGNIISASLLSGAHRASIGVAGYILSATPWNIIGAYRADANLANDALRAADSMQIARGQDDRFQTIRTGGGEALPTIEMVSPDAILNLTVGVNGVNNYNEVAVRGTSAFGAKVRVSGMFVKVRANGGGHRLLDLADSELRGAADTLFLYSDEVLGAMRTAIQGGLPLIAITDGNTNELFETETTLTSLGPVAAVL